MDLMPKKTYKMSEHRIEHLKNEIVTVLSKTFESQAFGETQIISTRNSESFVENQNIAIKIITNNHIVTFYPKGFPRGNKYYLTIDNRVFELRNEADILEIKKILSIYINLRERIIEELLRQIIQDPAGTAKIDRVLEEAKEALIKYAQI